VSIFKRKGSPFYQYDLIFKGRRCWGSTKLTNRVAAQRYENRLRDRLAKQRGGILDPELPPLFSNFADEFLERVKPELRPKSYLRYEVSLKVLRDEFGAKRLDEIAADEIERFKQSRLEQGRSPSTVNRDLAFLRRVLLFAVRMDVLAGTPFTAHKVKFLREHGRERILSFEEERRYLVAANQLLRDVATLILEMGLRPGEACSIQCGDVHFYTATPFLHVPFGKTKNAVRDVPLTERAKEVLKRRLAQAEGEYIFPLRVGRGFDWSHPMCELHPAHWKALEDSGIETRFQIYDLRHTYGTRAAEAGVDVLTLQRLMGHADLKTTSRYVHLSKRHLAEAQTRIERYRTEREIAEAQARSQTQAGADVVQ
jgi:integrase